MSSNLLDMKGITKYIFDSYGKAIRNTNVKILDNVDFNLKEGEVHVLVGENGAGKSTLMRILGGAIPPDIGEMIINGERVTLKNPKNARELGVGFIHQELNLCSNLTVAENIFLGREITKNGIKDKKQMREKSKELLQSLGFDIEPKTLVRNLSTAQQQIIEIVKVMSFKSKIVIMDEPTASLTKKEIEILFDLIRKMKSEGVSIIYISHRFEEIIEIGDRVSVLRDGKYIGTVDIADFDYDEIIKMMVGRSLGKMYDCTHQTSSEVVLELKDLKIADNTLPININVKKGEIVGVGGLVGSGRTELAKSIFGSRDFPSGEIYYTGQKINKPKPHNLIKQGIMYLTEDRKDEGLILPMSIKENISLASLSDLFKKCFITKKPEKKLADEMVGKLNVISKSIMQMVNTLSGGNQQKVVLAKCLAVQPKLLILDEPTRGIDVNAKKEIYKIIDSIAAEGVAVLMISSELPELIGMSDRIYVMKNGAIAGEITDKKEMIQEKILELTIGKSDENKKAV